MNDIDRTIRDALRADDDEWMKDFEEPSVHEMLVGVFQGKTRWLAALGFVFTLIFLGLAIFCAVQFFQAETTRAMIAWATGFLFCSLSVSMMKIWYWLQMTRNIMTREIKRFELQLVRLSGRLDD